MSLDSELISDPEHVSPEARTDWDALAVAAGRPFRLSAWQLAAAEHLCDGPLQIVLLRDGGRLAGVAPFCRIRWPGPLWIESALQIGWNFGYGVGPLAAPGREAALTREIAALLPPVSMVTVAWDDLDSPWPGRIAGAWNGRMHRRLEGTMLCPAVTMAESHDAWLAGRSRHFRERIRSRTRAIEKRGATVRRCDDPARVADDIDGMFAVHHARFQALGKRSDLTDAHRAALVTAAPDLLRAGHLRLWVVEHEGRVVAAQALVRAGDSMNAYMNGMDPDWHREAPGMVLLHATVRDAHEIGARTLILGPGASAYKQRFSDTEVAIGSHDLFVVDRRYPLVRARLARKHLTAAARRRAAELPEERREQLKHLLRR